MTSVESTMLNLWHLAREVKMSQAELVAQLVADGMPVQHMGGRRWRLDAESWAAWRAKCAQRAVTTVKQWSDRAAFVAGESEAPAFVPGKRPKTEFRL